MTEPLFTDAGKPPDDAALAAALGRAKRHWDAILASLPEDGIAREWKFYGAKYGWQLKIAKGKRAMLYLVPRPSKFGAALALPDQAVAALRGSGLPAALVQEIESARRYPEGRPARIEVSAREDAEIVQRLLAIKLEHAGARSSAPSRKRGRA